MAIDIIFKNLDTPIERFEHIGISLKLIPEEIINQYNLSDIVNKDSYIYIETRHGMYSLPQAGMLAYEQLEYHLSGHEYYPSKHTLGLWLHCTRSISFCHVVDNFGVKYDKSKDAHHLINT